MTDKVTEIVESATTNNGQRTVLKSVLAPYATVPSHFHTLFTETFEVIEGAIDVWNGFGKIHLEKGQAASIDRNTFHHYVVGKMETTIFITLEPGNIQFENAIKINEGVKRDGYYSSINSSKNDNIEYLAIIAELTDSNYTGDTKDQIDELLNSKGYKVEQLKRKWLDTYFD